MKQHRYRISVEHLSDPQGAPSLHPEPLRFETGNHDDILAIVARLRQRGDFTAEDAAALGVGLKLFGEVMLAHKTHPLFAGFLPQFGVFMRGLKQGKPDA